MPVAAVCSQWSVVSVAAVCSQWSVVPVAGWQPRWFILSDGVLSYYRSADDVNDGCKGSIKMAVCDVAGTGPSTGD